LEQLKALAGGHLWLKDGGSPQVQDNSKMYGVGDHLQGGQQQ
jgi:hypothetical protein